MISGSASINATSSLIPASMICGIAFNTALIIPFMICGIAATIALIISGNASTSDVNN